jgi:hypothetical protein
VIRYLPCAVRPAAHRDCRTCAPQHVDVVVAVAYGEDLVGLDAALVAVGEHAAPRPWGEVASTPSPQGAPTDEGGWDLQLGHNSTGPQRPPASVYCPSPAEG